ncbi:hypothetical protein BE20_46010 [Sorangium cellulosum]|uniref:Terpene synthase n=1 Tax=Sorangium cellulosum TaxID=56 RepID=A0A150SSY0_SORCE|nr:hypothetical protein BE20_46010 [Sorangium cellulosum]KYF98747.1 hypothetical protein BE18_08520 [Sorangium cellulosum]
MEATAFRLILDATIDCAKRSLQTMPDCTYRAYCSWILDADDPLRDRWLQLVGVNGLIRLTVGLLDGIVRGNEWERLAGYAASINVQQTYEVVSDNLAIGLAHPREGDDQFATRRALLRAFDGAMIERLKGSPRSAQQLLLPVEPMARRISAFEQSLSPDKHRALTDAFLCERAGVSREELEYSVWPSLIANVETTYDLARTTASCRMGEMVTQGLISRYEGVDSLLEEPRMTFSERLRASTGAIMVIPTLAYYVAVLAEMIRPSSGLSIAIDEGLLTSALHDAALQVRLLNDVGPRLLAQTDGERRVLMDSLKASAARSDARTLDALLFESLKEWAPLFTRIRKDVLHREFNLCVHDYSTDVADALPVFEEELACAAREYHRSRARLASSTSELDALLGDAAVGRLIRRFVEFHETLYMRDYDDPLGEYAV